MGLTQNSFFPVPSVVLRSYNKMPRDIKTVSREQKQIIKKGEN